MKTKHLLLLLPLLFLTQFSFGQNHILKGRGLLIPGRPILYYNVGIGYEYLIEENMSLQLVYNCSGNDLRDTDGNANFKNEVVLDFRFYNTEIKPVSQAFFAFAFLSYSFENNKFGGEIVTATNPSTRKQTTEDKGIGVGVGKNFKLSRLFHLEVFAGPKISLEKITTENSDGISFLYNSSYDTIKFSIRAGINLAYRF